MIHIHDKYYLDSDAYQYIVVEKRIGISGKSKGKEVFENVAYCGTLAQVKNFLMNKEIREDLEILTNIDRLNQLSESIDLLIKKYS